MGNDTAWLGTALGVALPATKARAKGSALVQAMAGDLSKKIGEVAAQEIAEKIELRVLQEAEAAALRIAAEFAGSAGKSLTEQVKAHLAVALGEKVKTLVGTK